MALDNEYKAKGETASSSESKNSWEKKSSTKKTSTSRKKKRTKKKSPTMISSITDRINTKKLKSSIGVGLLLAALFIFLANFSYLLTWREDQNRVLETGFFQFLFDGNETPVAKWLGKFGAWTSHLIIYRWFGIASFGIPLLLTVWGIKALFNRAVLPLRKVTSGTILFTIWFSLLSGSFRIKSTI